MSDMMFDELDELKRTKGTPAAIERLIESLRSTKEYDKLFDALLLKKKSEMGLPMVQPTSFDTVPAEMQEQFEEHYIAAAREIGELHLAENNISQAWLYFRTIHEPEKVREALDAIPISREATEQTEELINVALYEGAHPVKGLEMMLRTHGTCNTITALDQQISQLSPEDRKDAARLLVRELYDDLCHTVRHEVTQKIAMVEPGSSLRELLTGRDWLFEEGNYHIDVSHLHSVVRFARFLDGDDPELSKAIELAEYGCRLADQLQYPGDTPFDEFYPAHQKYFAALADQNRDQATAYFQARLESEEEDRALIAYVLVDLYLRCDLVDEAVKIAEKYLTDVDESAGFSFSELCRTAGRLDLLRQTTRAHGDLVGYAAALLQDAPESATA
jgi:hypothetical protein